MKQPDLSTRKALLDIEMRKADVISIPGCRKKFKIRFLCDYTIQKITQLLLEREELEEAAKGDDSDAVMRSAVRHPYFTIKMASLATLNTPFKIAIFHPFLWRWWAYVRHFDEEQMAPVAEAVQKKNQLVCNSVLGEYQVLAGYEDGFDDDSKGRTRPIPSRTHLGRIAAFVKDFPQYGDRRWVPFVGWVENYTARCVLSTSQISLMQSDLPHTLYKHMAKDGDKDYNPNDPAFELQRKADERAAARRAARQEKEGYTIDEIFNGEADK